MRNLAIVALAAALGGCASSAADITPSYVSPVQYSSYNCQQLTLEAQSVSARAAALSGAQDSQRTKDTLATTAAVVIFWPAAFLVGGDKQTASELAQMKGQMIAIEQASIAKNAISNFRASQREPEIGTVDFEWQETISEPAGLSRMSDGPGPNENAPTTKMTRGEDAKRVRRYHAIGLLEMLNRRPSVHLQAIVRAPCRPNGRRARAEGGSAG